MTDAAPQPEPQPELHEGWDSALANLRTRFPGTASDGVLFCVYKLETDPEVRLADIRDEARLRSVPLSGRSLHSAKVLLGLAPPATRKPNKTASPRKERPSAPAAASSSLENQLAVTLRQIHGAANAESERLRTAIREAVEILGAALDATDEDEA